MPALCVGPLCQFPKSNVIILLAKDTQDVRYQSPELGLRKSLPGHLLARRAAALNSMAQANTISQLGVGSNGSNGKHAKDTHKTAKTASLRLKHVLWVYYGVLLAYYGRFTAIDVAMTQRIRGQLEMFVGEMTGA